MNLGVLPIGGDRVRQDTNRGFPVKILLQRTIQVPHKAGFRWTSSTGAGLFCVPHPNRKEVTVKSRALKVCPLYRDNVYRGYRTSSTVVPNLRRAGHWLEQAGFEIGQQVTVTVQHGKLIITPSE